jgi:hypothetical protein
MGEFVLEKDTLNRRVLLRSYIDRWEDYLSPEDWRSTAGWLSAPDHTYHISNPQMAEAAGYQKHPIVKSYNTADYTKNTSKYSGSGFDLEAPYGLWAQIALNNIKLYLAKYCHQDDRLCQKRDEIYRKIENFLFAHAKNQQATLDFGDLPVGLTSTLMGQMSLYLGNAEHESKQINHALELDVGS